MVREARRMAVILDADVVGRARVTANDESNVMARLAQHRVERLEPVLARHGGRLVRLPDGSARAEFPNAVAALAAAIEFQQAVADTNRHWPGDSAVVFHLSLHEASEDGAARRVGKQEQERAGGIVVSAALRDAVAGRVAASFAELGSSGLGTVERPLHTYEVGWDPADWPAASAAAARPLTAPDDGKGAGRWVGAIALAMMLTGGGYLLVGPRPPPASAVWHASAEKARDPAVLQRRAEAAMERWQLTLGEADEVHDEPANPDNAAPADSHDGTYAGTATTRPDGRVVTFKLKVTGGVGAGILIQRECGASPITLKVSPTGSVSGLALMSGSTCLRTELAIRGRAIGDTLQLRLGNQYLKLSKFSD